MVEAPDEFKISPEEAKGRLEVMGFTDDTWGRIMKSGLNGDFFGSHEVRALIIIARGTEPKVLGQVYNEIRKNEGLKEKRSLD